MAFNHAQHLIASLGEGELLALGFTERNLRHVKSVGKFSAQWFAVIDDACRKKGLLCPREAFNWKVSAKDNGKSSPVNSAGINCNGGGN